MAKERKFSKRPAEGAARTFKVSTDNPNPLKGKRKGNPTKSGEIFGKWRKPKLK